LLIVVVFVIGSLMAQVDWLGYFFFLYTFFLFIFSCTNYDKWFWLTNKKKWQCCT